MRWPKLVAAFTQSMPVSAVVDLDGIDEDGAPIEGARWEGRCNWQDRTMEAFAKDKAETRVVASLYIDGDPFPTVPVIAGGTVVFLGDERTIAAGTKSRNPDGTVNFTRLDLS